MSETKYSKTWPDNHGATYRAHDRLHNEAGYCFRAKIKDLALQLIFKSFNILSCRFSLDHIAARIARRYELGLLG